MEHSEKCVTNPAALRSSANMLSVLTDQRAARGIRYAWLPLFTITLLAKLPGVDMPIELADVMHYTQTEMRILSDDTNRVWHYVLTAARVQRR